MLKPYFCTIDNKYHNKITIVRILKKYNINIKEYYDANYKSNTEGYCLSCNKPTKFLKFRYYKFCNVKCGAVYNCNTSKISKENRKIYINKMLETKSKYTREQWQVISEKRMKSVENKVGMPYYKYMSLLFHKRYQNMSNLERLEYFDKATGSTNYYSNKEYILNNIVYRVQGYEPYVLNILKELFNETDIILGRTNIPMFKYKNNTKRYYPDIMIKSLNLIIEVKSKFTLDKDKNLLSKKKSVEYAGFKFLLVLWNNSTYALREQSKNKLLEAISSQANYQLLEGSTTIRNRSKI